MTRIAHDIFAKDLLKEILKPLGEFQTSLEVIDEPRQIDAWFVPAPISEAERSKLGLLGTIASEECLLEPVRAQLSPIEIRNCMRRQLIFFGERQREAAQRKRNLKESDFPQLWILCPTVSAEVLALFGAEEKEGWPQGVYFAPDGYKMAIVVLNQLPETPETLWLRMLGKGKVQRRAFAELNTLPEEEPLAKKIKDVVLRWYSAIQGKKPENAEEEELIMELITSYEEWQKATLQQGLQQGLEQGRVQTQRQFIENFLMARFGAIDETLASAIEPLLKLSMERLTRLMLELSSLEQDEFLARLSREPELQQPDVDNSNPSP